MPRWTNEQFTEYISRRAPNSGARSHSLDEEQQANVVHEQADKRMDEEGISKYRVTITLLVSDKRSRDADNGISTLLDCYTLALGRLIGMDRRALRKLASSEERRGRRDNRN